MKGVEVVRVLVVAPWPPPGGGIATWCVMLQNYSQTQESAHLEFVSTSHAGMKVAGRGLRDRVWRQGIGMIGVLRIVLSRLRCHSLDIVHVTCTGQLSIVRDAAVLVMARMFRVPTIYHMRFGRIPDIASRGTLEWGALGCVLRLATRVLVIDQHTESVIRRRLPSVTVQRVPNPVDIDALSHPGRLGQVVVFAGWVTAAKGVEELLQSWVRLASDRPTWRLELVGPVEDGYLRQLKSTYSLPRVTFCGELSHSETLDRILHAGVFVLPSYTEGFPNVILEAMACARPVVATSVGAIPEMLRDGAGILVAPGNVDELTRGLASAIDDSVSSADLGTRARERVLREYSLPRVFGDYVSIWQQAASREIQGH